MRYALLFLTAPLLPAVAATLEVGTYEGRHAWILTNGDLRVSILRGGGHIAEVRLISKDPKTAVNPMRVPHYRTIDPSTYDPQRHDALYGNGPSRWLMSGYMGHLICFPNYGPASAEEEKAGYGNHGEAPLVDWRQVRVEETAAGFALTLEASLPKTRYRMRRVVTFPAKGRQFSVSETIENQENFDRPYQWMQHATFGPPFVEPGKTVLDASVTHGQTRARATGGSLASDVPVEWPKGKGPDGRPVDLRSMQPVERAGAYVALRTDPARKQQFFTLFHPGYKVLIGYVTPSDMTPWLADWQENRSNAAPPWENKVIARGIEFGNTAFDEGIRNAVDRASFLGAPTYSWIAAKGKREWTYTIFLQEIPEGFAGVKDVVLESGAARIVPR